MSPAHDPGASGGGVSTRPSILGPGVTFADYVDTTAHDPQPGWRTLQAVQEAAFTGELRFASVPAYVAYADHGTVYHAQRSTDPPVHEQLLRGGVVTEEQVEIGSVHIGELVHIGRMFDRDPSINRPAVAAFVAGATIAALAEIGDLPAASVAITAFRHHPAGLHHWYAPVVGGVPSSAPAADPGHDANGHVGTNGHATNGHAAIERTQPPTHDRRVPDQPPTGIIEDATSGDDRRPEITIEWHDTDLVLGGGPDERVGGRRGDDPRSTPPAVDDPVASELADFDADRVDWGPGFARYRGGDDDRGGATNGNGTHVPMEPFEVVWPDGSRGRADDADTVTADDGVTAAALHPTTAMPVPSEPTAPDHAAVDPTSPAADATTVHAEPSGPAPIDGQRDTHTHDDTVDDDVPEDVADAVRRALVAIEVAADTGAPPPKRIVIPPPPPPPSDVTIESAPAPAGFAPPTPDMHVDAVYARAVEAKVWHDSTGHEISPAGDDGNERRGALRRLIGSLRRGG